ncbi:hypothetical protein PG990_000818 [Apiospora arundinis]|uniref:Uncharacterized protein n=1 Tax=Apiospora arundinis TaxID=335852 RepID=A0ABR2I0I5_9PEZI
MARFPKFWASVLLVKVKVKVQYCKVNVLPNPAKSFSSKSSSFSAPLLLQKKRIHLVQKKWVTDYVA